MGAGRQEPTNLFKQIFADGWDDFTRRHPRYAAMDEVVHKMLGCGDPAQGHAVYLCPDCLQRHVVAFSCKSAFCLSCAKVHGQKWVEKVQGMLHPGGTYRHLILTVPGGLQTLLYQHPAVLLDGLMQAAHTAMDAVVTQAKRQMVTLSLHRGVADGRARRHVQCPSAYPPDRWGAAGGWDVAAALAMSRMICCIAPGRSTSCRWWRPGWRGTRGRRLW